LSGLQSKPFSQFLAFGDSSIDSGYFATSGPGGTAASPQIAAAIANGGSGTPVGEIGEMNSQILASDLGLTAVPNNPNQTSGTNHAISGAFDAAVAANGNSGNINSLTIPAAAALHSVVQQITDYLTANGNVADPNAIYLISSGGNDVVYAYYHIAAANQDSYLQSQAANMTAAIQTLQADGAKHIIVNNLPYLNALTAPNAGTILEDYYTNSLYSQLNSAGVNYIQGDINSVVKDVQNNPTLFGFTANTVLPGIVGPTNTSSAFITPTGVTSASSWGIDGANTTTPSSSYAYLRSANAEQTSLFSDDQHLSAAGQQIEANYDYSLLYKNNLVAQGALDLADIQYIFGQTKATYTPNSGSPTTGGTLNVTDGTHTANIALLGNYLASKFNTMSDGGTGTLVIDPPSNSQQAHLIMPHHHA
jgi:outer membrane lipase/esterase